MTWHSRFKSMVALVMFDLPTGTKKERRMYGKFRRELLKSGFLMLQFSAYYKYLYSDESVNKVKKDVERFSPKNKFGSIYILMMTVKQFDSMVIIYAKDEEELQIEQKYSGKTQLLLF